MGIFMAICDNGKKEGLDRWIIVACEQDRENSKNFKPIDDYEREDNLIQGVQED